VSLSFYKNINCLNLSSVYLFWLYIKYLIRVIYSCIRHNLLSFTQTNACMVLAVNEKCIGPTIYILVQLTDVSCFSTVESSCRKHKLSTAVVVHNDSKACPLIRKIVYFASVWKQFHFSFGLSIGPISNHFNARQHICYNAYMPRQFRPSVRLSVTRVYCVKTAERIIEILSPSDRPNILVFRHQRSLRKPDCFTPPLGRQIQGGSNN